MLFLKYLLLITGWGLLGWAAAIALNNLYRVVQYHRQTRTHIAPLPESPTSASLGAVVASGMGGIRVSQTSGTRPGTFYPGVHLIVPLVDSVALYDLRD